MKRSVLTGSGYVFILLLSCAGPKEKNPENLPIVKNSQKVVIYQMLPRLFTNLKTSNTPYGTLEKNGVGKFNEITTTALSAIKNLGVNHIWFTGVLEHAVLTDYTRFGIPLDDADIVKGRAGTPYAIKDYYDVDPDLAVDVPNRINEFEQLIDRTHKLGMKVIIDFVPNNVARAYKSDVKAKGARDLGEGDDLSKPFSPGNNFYYLPGQSFQVPQEYSSLGSNPFPTKDKKFEETPAKVTGSGPPTASPGINEQFETVKLNYGIDISNDSKYFDPRPSTWEKMRDVLLYWASKKIDGFSCDMAEMVPVEFWEWVIPEIKKINDEIIFVADIRNPAQYRNYAGRGHFDFLYDKVQLYDTLRLMANQRASTANIPGIQSSLKGLNEKMVHFLENHNEQRIASPFFIGDPWKAVPAMVISAMIDRGPIMIYFGQEVGEPGKGIKGFGSEDGRTTIYDYWGVPEHQKWVNNGAFDGGRLNEEQMALRQFYGDILTLAGTNPAIGQGGYADLTESNIQSKNMSGKIHAFVRKAGDERLIIVSGFNDKTEHARIQLTPESLDLFSLESGHSYIGRDLLRSGLDIGLDDRFAFELDIPPYSSFIIKIK